MKQITAFITALCLCFSLVGCGRHHSTSIPVSSSAPDFTNSADLPKEKATDGPTAATDFGIRLLRGAHQPGESLLLSPVSVLYALGMVLNGADGDTLSQMEAVLGIERDDLCLFLSGYAENLPQTEQSRTLSANKIWFTDDSRFTVNPDFLETNQHLYGACWERAPMDEKTRLAINRFVSQKTEDMIPQLLSVLPQDTVMCLVNALSFEGTWQQPYTEEAVRKGLFTCADSTEKEIDFLYSTEYAYLEGSSFTGFLKAYEGGGYTFAVLLPHENLSMEEFLDGLSGAELHRLLCSPADVPVRTALPKFKADYGADFSSLLANMGMPLAFNPTLADFSSLGSSTDENIFMDLVLHKAFLQVDEEGTRAAASTAVVMKDNAAFPLTDCKEVYCDRPFVYLLLDCETMTPLFMGVMEETD